MGEVEYKGGYPTEAGWYDCLLDGKEVILRYRYCHTYGRYEWWDDAGNRIRDGRQVLWTGPPEKYY